MTNLIKVLGPVLISKSTGTSLGGWKEVDQ